MLVMPRLLRNAALASSVVASIPIEAGVVRQLDRVDRLRGIAIETGNLLHVARSSSDDAGRSPFEPRLTVVDNGVEKLNVQRAL